MTPSSENKSGQLYLVSTPIGNLEDITLRAIRILKEVDAIACEDTRHTQKLLNHYAIKKRLVSYHEHNENTRAPELLSELKNGAGIALVTDAGTPIVSDPGHRLVALCAENNIPVIPIPGPSAVLAALAGSGISAKRVLFVGFLPARQGERRRALSELANNPATLVFFEAPHRIANMLTDASEILGPRPAALARELTKLHEEFLRGSLDDLARKLSPTPLKGEFTLVIGPPAPQDSTAAPTGLTLRQRVEQLIRTESLDRKAALKLAAREFGIPRREAYKQLLQDGNLTNEGPSEE
nr:16S rRNA (cytidine(1402)-2'-O)-methyltransferase [Candidatus Acidoferrales bacterium]